MNDKSDSNASYDARKKFSKSSKTDATKEDDILNKGNYLLESNMNRYKVFDKLRVNQQ